jgi:IBR domain, a half RING-finger domain
VETVRTHPELSFLKGLARLTATSHESLAARHAMQNYPDFVWCLSPRCEWGQRHDPRIERFVCSRCGFQTCYKHQVPWHEGISCRQYDGYDQPPRVPKPKMTVALKRLLGRLNMKTRSKRVEEPVDSSESLRIERKRTVALMETASKQKCQALKSRVKIGDTCKKCPRAGCGAPIERASGCSRMKCGRCGCEFCFTCLCLWHFGHYDSCNDMAREGYRARTVARPYQFAI